MENTRPPEDAESLFSIRIEGLTNDATKDDLNQMFESYGKIGDIYIPRNTREGGNRGFGFVRFYKQEDAQSALQENGKSLHDQEIRVTMAEARPPRRETRYRSRSYDRYRRSRSRSGSGHRRYRSRSRSHSHHRRSPSRSYDRSYHSSSRRDRSSRRNPSNSRSASRHSRD